MKTEINHYKIGFYLCLMFYLGAIFGFCAYDKKSDEKVHEVVLIPDGASMCYDSSGRIRLEQTAGGNRCPLHGVAESVSAMAGPAIAENIGYANKQFTLPPCYAQYVVSKAGVYCPKLTP